METMLHQSQAGVGGRDPDNWYGVQDKRERKKIQDRLAQRSRRKRLAEMKQSRAAAEIQEQQIRPPSTSSVFASSFAENEWGSDQYLMSQPCPLDLYFDSQDQHTTYSEYSTSGAVLGANALSSQYSVKAAEVFSHMMSNVGAETKMSSIPSATASAAMYSNAILLQLSGKNAAVPMKSPLRESVPGPLRPTHLQMTVSHLPYIDAIPFPAVRQNLIAFADVIDQDAFCGDLNNPNSVSVTGNQSWDPSEWKISDDFMRRWGFLFYENAT